MPRINHEKEERAKKHNQISYIFRILMTFAFTVAIRGLPLADNTTPQHNYCFSFCLSLSLEISYVRCEYDVFSRRRLLTMASTFRLLFYSVRSVTGRGGGM